MERSSESSPSAPRPSRAARPSKAGGHGIDLRQGLLILRAHLYTALALALVACTALVWSQLARPKLYLSSATLNIEREEGPAAIRGDEWDPMERMGEVATRIEQMKSPDVVRLFIGSLSPDDRRLILHAYYPDGPPPIGDDRALQKIVRQGLTVTRVPETLLVEVGAVNRDPAAAALIANRFADQIIQYLHDRSVAASEAALTYLRGQADDLRKRIESEDRDLQSFRQKYNLVSLEDNQNIVVDRLKTLNNQATTARIARLAVESRLNEAQTVLKRSKDSAQLAAIAEFSGLADVQHRIDDLQAKRAVMAEKYGRKHPAMLQNGEEMQALIHLRDDQVQAALASLNNQLDKASSDERQLAEQLAAAEQESLRLDRIGVDYNTLRRTAESDKTTYSQLLSRLNEATISAQLQGVKVAVSEHAQLATFPFSPNLQKTILITAAVGLLIIFGYPFAAESIYGRVRSWHDVEQHLETALLAEIGSAGRTKESDRPSLIARDLDDELGEQFRALHSQLSLTSKVDIPKTILVTSTIPGEGKSFIASNLAATLVRHSRKVLLVDADWRRPALHRGLGLDNKAGILRWLEEPGPADLDPTEDPRLGLVEVIPGLTLLRAGGNTRKACEWLDSGRLDDLWTRLKRRFDVVVLDTPPAGIFPDALAFAKLAQETVFICRFDRVSRRQARNVLRRLRQAGPEIPGVVLNAMPAGRGSAYYYSSYGYYSKEYSKYYEPRDA